jgi:predicted ATPase
MRGQARQQLRFTHVTLENWRNFTHVAVDLQRRAFLVGPNASGKSNLLDVFRFLHDIVAVGGGFREAVRKRGGVSRLRCLAARRYSDIAVNVRIGSDEAATVWEYELRFTQDNLRRPTITRERVTKDGTNPLLDRPNDDDERDRERLTQTYLEQVNVNQPFRDVADFLASVRYLHIIPQLIREPNRSVGMRNDPYGGDFLEQIARVPDKIKNPRLKRILKALTVAVPQLSELELERDERGTPHLRGRYEHWRPKGAWQNEDQFSDGTLRLIGLLWAVLDGSGPLLLEEPELSLHPEVVRYVPQMLARLQRLTGRQIMLSTHSTDLLRDDGIGLDEVLLLLPETEGTSVRLTSSFREIGTLLESGSSLADTVMPMTRPDNARQLALFAE